MKNVLRILSPHFLAHHGWEVKKLSPNVQHLTYYTCGYIPGLKRKKKKKVPKRLEVNLKARIEFSHKLVNYLF